ncbi:MAG: hypothetical protein IPM95_06975 [Sphingobacteriales bacterium]|nr:hypothetical protein [Sphingobacteriales bacterium]
MQQITLQPGENLTVLNPAAEAAPEVNTFIQDEQLTNYLAEENLTIGGNEDANIAAMEIINDWTAEKKRNFLKIVLGKVKENSSPIGYFPAAFDGLLMLADDVEDNKLSDLIEAIFYNN